jgi:hypothetical protein
MIKPDMEILIQDPMSKARLLHSAQVIEANEDIVSIEFASQDIAVDEGVELIAFFQIENKFMQQIVRVIEVIDDGSRQFVDLEYVGDPVSAENRESYRATTISADLAAEIGIDRDLTVQDVSDTGFAVVCTKEYPIGTVLEVALNFEGDFYSGTASVQSTREFSSQRIRYGMRVLEGGDLPDGLRQICLAVQRQQLQRKSGSN